MPARSFRAARPRLRDVEVPAEALELLLRVDDLPVVGFEHEAAAHGLRLGCDQVFS